MIINTTFKFSTSFVSPGFDPSLQASGGAEDGRLCQETGRSCQQLSWMSVGGQRTRNFCDNINSSVCDGNMIWISKLFKPSMDRTKIQLHLVETMLQLSDSRRLGVKSSQHV